MVTPNSPSSSQAIIDKFLTGGFSTQSTANPYAVEVTPYVPPSTPDPDPVTPDPCPEGYTFDSVLNVCVPIETTLGNDREVEEEPYQGVGSINSPTQNAFMNLGLGQLTGGDEIPSGFGFDSFNQGLKSVLGIIPPFGLPLKLGRMQDINTLINSGVIEKGSDGKLTFAKGGNLNLVQANQAFEQDLARQQGLNLDAVGENPLVYKDSLGNTFSQPYQQSRGDKANNMSNNVYREGIIGKNNNVTVSPFQSNYGASEIVSYSPPNPNRQKSASEKTFDRKQAEQGGQISRQSTSYKNKAR